MDHQSRHSKSSMQEILKLFLDPIEEALLDPIFLKNCLQAIRQPNYIKKDVVKWSA